MKKSTLFYTTFFLILVAGFALSFGLKTNGEQLHDRIHFKNENWYKVFLGSLTKENKIDLSDAAFIKITSSDSHTAFEEPEEKVVSRYGKIIESEIKTMFTLSGDHSTIYTITNLNNYCHLFIYSTKTGKLERIRNASSIVMTLGEVQAIKENNQAGLLFSSQYVDTKEKWTKCFYFDKKQRSFTHVRNCKIENGKEVCETIKPYIPTHK